MFILQTDNCHKSALSIRTSSFWCCCDPNNLGEIPLCYFRPPYNAEFPTPGTMWGFPVRSHGQVSTTIHCSKNTADSRLGHHLILGPFVLEMLTPWGFTLMSTHLDWSKSTQKGFFFCKIAPGWQTTFGKWPKERLFLGFLITKFQNFLTYHQIL
jgi:hypothetical protein